MNKYEKEALELYEKLKNEIIKYNPHYDDKILDNAFNVAYDAHKGYYKKSKDLYITHSIHTALILTKIGADELTIIGALLHDIILNEKYSFDFIKENFGKDVYNLINGINKLSNINYKINITDDEKKQIRSTIFNSGADLRVFLVKIADRFHNLQTLEYFDKDKRYLKAKETLDLYMPIVNFLSVGEFLDEMQDLCFKYTYEEEYKKLKLYFGKKIKKYQKRIFKINNTISIELNKLGLEVVNIESRIKKLYSIYKKLKRKDITINDIYDIIGFRIITKNKRDAYMTLGLIHNIYNVKIERFKDYISMPKDNGYQAIHTTVLDEYGEYIEFQILTKDMAILNTSGIAAHFLYKGFGLDYSNIPKWMNGILNLQKQTFNQDLYIQKLKNEIFVTEIKCFHINGEEIILPKGAVLIDFAFSISHSNGIHFIGAIVNGEAILDPFYELKNGDYIKLKKDNKVIIDFKINNFLLTKTQKARDGLKEIFINYKKEKIIELGEILLNNKLQEYALQDFLLQPRKIRKTIINELGLEDETQLYLFIGMGSTDVNTVLVKILNQIGKKNLTLNVSLRIYQKTIDHININILIKILYELNVKVNKIIYNIKKNYIFLEINILEGTFDNIYDELTRVPNVKKIIKHTPKRIKLYYLFLVITGGFIFGLSYFLNFLYINDILNLDYVRLIVFLGGCIMFGSLFFIKHIIYKIYGDLLSYKRFWSILFVGNTIIYINSIYLLKIFNFGFNIPVFFYIMFYTYIYLLLFYNFKKYKTKGIF